MKVPPWRLRQTRPLGPPSGRSLDHESAVAFDFVYYSDLPQDKKPQSKKLDPRSAEAARALLKDLENLRKHRVRRLQIRVSMKSAIS